MEPLTNCQNATLCRRSFMIYWLRADASDALGTFIEKEKFRQVPQIYFFMHAVRRFMLEFIDFFFMQTNEKETQQGNYVLCAKSAFVRQFSPRATRVL